MPSSGYNVTNTFAAQTGPIPLSQLDTNFDQPRMVLNTMATFSNYFVDSSGAANSITVTAPPPLVVSYLAGLAVQVQVGNSTTSSSVNININSMGPKLIVNCDGSSLVAGQISSGQILNLIYDGTNFRIISQSIQREFYKYRTTQGGASGSVLADDTQLIFPSMPAGTYSVRGYLQPECQTTTTQGFKWKLRVAGTTSGNTYLSASGIINNASYGPFFTPILTTVVQHPNVQTAQTDFITFDSVFTTTTAGDIALQWAQNSSSANITVLNDRSWIRVSLMS